MKMLSSVLVALLFAVSCTAGPHAADGYAYIDFTNKADGDPPAELDTGQRADFLQAITRRKPQVVDGELVRGDLRGLSSRENFANYYQAQLDDDCHSFGARWTIDGDDGSSTDGFAVLATWGDVYQAGATRVPKTAAHITISALTAAWTWWVGDGGETDGVTHLRSVKSGTFAPPASDGLAVWNASVRFDPDNGIGYLYLPGSDSATGTTRVSLTDEEIAAALAADGLPVMTLADLLDGSSVVMVEHYANVGEADTARFPRFRDMWAKSRTID